MQSKRFRVIGVLLALIGLLAGLVQGDVVSASGGVPVAPADKVAPWVLERTEAGGTTSFLVIMATQADTSLPGDSPLDWNARGRYVYNRLVETAERSQKDLRETLDARGVAYRAYWIVNMLAVQTGSRALALDLAARADVARIAANPEVRVALPEAVPAPTTPQTVEGQADAPGTVEWGVQNVRAPEVWAQGYTGAGIVVAGQDTGYRWTHQSIKSKYRGWAGFFADHNYNWWDAIHDGNGGDCGIESPEPCDDSGHGTHTMATIVGGDGSGPDRNDVGLAYEAKWIGCRNMDEGVGTPQRYMECDQFFMAPTDLQGHNANPDKRPQVVNNSWACPESEGCTDPDVLRLSVTNLVNSGVLYVVSTGNEGSDCETVLYPPAIYAVSWSVGAIDSANELTSFSSRGPVTVDGSNRRKPDVSAPGEDVRSAYNSGDSDYESLSGTSMAGPHVVGAVALFLDAHPEYIGLPSATRRAFERAVNPDVDNSFGADSRCGNISINTRPNNHFGYGRIDVYAAIADAPSAVVLGEAQVRGAAADSGAYTLLALLGLMVLAVLAVLARRR